MLSEFYLFISCFVFLPLKLYSLTLPRLGYVHPFPQTFANNKHDTYGITQVPMTQAVGSFE